MPCFSTNLTHFDAGAALRRAARLGLGFGRAFAGFADLADLAGFADFTGFADFADFAGVLTTLRPVLRFAFAFTAG